MRSGVEVKEGWATGLLLILLLLCVAWSIQAAGWAAGLFVLVEVVLLGGILGIVLGKARIPSRTAHLLSGLAGFTWCAWLVSRVLAASLELRGELAVLELDWRLRLWLTELFTKGSSDVGGIFLLVLCLLMWLTAYVSAWAVFRWQRVWWAIIVCSVAMLINVTATEEQLTVFLLAYLLIALLLVVRASLTSYESEWRRARVHYSTDLTFAFLRAGLIVSILAITFAWVVPDAAAGDGLAKAWRSVSEPWRRFQRAWDDLFQDMTYQPETRVIYLPRSTRFSGAVHLTDRPVLDVRASTGRYWRRVVYDAYMGSGWANTDPETISVEPNDQRLLDQPSYELRGVLTQTVTLLQDRDIGWPIVAVGEPLLVSIPVEAVASLITSTSSLTGTVDAARAPPGLAGTSQLYLRDGLTAGSTYEVATSVSSADIESLRNSGLDYPSWVVPRYVALPESLPSRVRILAEEVVKGAETPYDKAAAIESYLRKIPYNEEIGGPRERQDGVDYFLFAERQGYCTYYASAMVVMLRAVGVPARYVEGYSQDRADKGVYHILEKDGHAWPEVFFPEYGWIEFEPTASESVLRRALSPTRPAGDEQGGVLPLRPTPQMEERELGERPSVPAIEPPRVPLWQRIPTWAWAVLAGVLVLLAVAGMLMARRRRRVAGLSDIERVYLDLVTWVGPLLGVWPQAHQTPHEYAQAVGEVAPAQRIPIDRICDLYVQERFGGKRSEGHVGDALWRETWPALSRRWVQRQGERARRAWDKVVRSRPVPER